MGLADYHNLRKTEPFGLCLSNKPVKSTCQHFTAPFIIIMVITASLLRVLVGNKLGLRQSAGHFRSEVSGCSSTLVLALWGEREKKGSWGINTIKNTQRHSGLSEADCAAGDIDWNAAGREIQRQKEGDVGFKVLPDQLGLM